MISQQTLQGNWHEVKGLLRSKWGALTDDDVAVFNGNVEELMGTIQRKTGEARESVEQFFEQLEFERCRRDQPGRRDDSRRCPARGGFRPGNVAQSRRLGA